MNIYFLALHISVKLLLNRLMEYSSHYGDVEWFALLGNLKYPGLCNL